MVVMESLPLRLFPKSSSLASGMIFQFFFMEGLLGSNLLTIIKSLFQKRKKKEKGICNCEDQNLLL